MKKKTCIDFLDVADSPGKDFAWAKQLEYLHSIEILLKENNKLLSDLLKEIKKG